LKESEGFADSKSVSKMTREQIASERALKLHDDALSVVRSKGVPKLDGSATVIEYRYGLLVIQYYSGLGQLDVWFGDRVLSVERYAFKPMVTLYLPGLWEEQLILVSGSGSTLINVRSGTALP